MNKEGKKGKPEEKRRYIRHLLVSPLEFQVSDEETEKTETVNVSEGGLMFISKKYVEPGKKIKLNMPLYDKVFTISAEVVHCEKEETTKLHRIGVAFVSYADAFKVKLIEQIYLIEEYRELRSLQLGREISLQEASKEWIKRYSERFEKLYW
ncbi:MAG: PilZ domain-containing protein [Candidatus Omnitrophica bacterium]|nr:PilZ domain-containing protein [Candidatus Omnitrophota bacterium]